MQCVPGEWGLPWACVFSAWCCLSPSSFLGTGVIWLKTSRMQLDTGRAGGRQQPRWGTGALSLFWVPKEGSLPVVRSRRCVAGGMGSAMPDPAACKTAGSGAVRWGRFPPSPPSAPLVCPRSQPRGALLSGSKQPGAGTILPCPRAAPARLDDALGGAGGGFSPPGHPVQVFPQGKGGRAEKHL